LSTQQLGDLNAELARARAARAETEARAQLVQSLLDEGGSLEASQEVLESQLIQRLQERQVALRSQIADLSTTLLPGHPRIRALEGQLANLEGQIRQEGRKVQTALNTAARVAAAREESLMASINEAKVDVSRSDEQEIELRALEREATAQRDLLESLLARYREASARTDADYLPPDARIISQAVAPGEPSFPKKKMMAIAAALATFLIGAAIVLLRQFTSGRAFRVIGYGVPDVPGGWRFAEDSGLVRIAHSPPPPRAPERPPHPEEGGGIDPAASRIRPAAIEPAADVVTAARPTEDGPLFTDRIEPGFGDAALLSAAHFAAEAPVKAIASTASPEVDNIEAVEPVAPAEPVEPIDPIASIEPAEPAEAVKAVEAVAPAEPVEPIDPIASIEPAEPAELVRPTQPVAPAPGIPASGDMDGEPAGAAELADILAGGGVRVAVFAGAEGGEGAGDIAFAAARNAARSKLRLVVMDLGPVPSMALGGYEQPGLGDLLKGNAAFGEVIQRDETSRVHFIPMGALATTSPLQRLQIAIGALTHTYDKVIVVANSLRDWPDEQVKPDLVAIVCGSETTEDLRAELYDSVLERGAGSALIVRYASDAEGEVEPLRESAAA
jgi:Mrp family chromosome partitioning ATPase